MNDELLKMLPMSEIDADIHSSVPGYWQQTKRPSIWSASDICGVLRNSTTYAYISQNLLTS